MRAGALREQLELRRVGPDVQHALAEFFADLVAAGDERAFHPHPFTPEAAAERAGYAGLDVFCVAVAGGRVLGYGMLRGWDEGFSVPSLGIAIHPAARGIGLGRTVMAYLHSEARRRGAIRVRLKVYPDNAAAVALYRSLGYEFTGTEDGQMVGFKTLSSR